MTIRLSRLAILCFAGVMASLQVAGSGSGESPALRLLEQNCLECHNSKTKKSGLDLSRLESALEGGTKGPALVPSHPESSLIYSMVEGGLMPLTGPRLGAEDLRIMHDWIKAGAEWETILGQDQEAKRTPASQWWAFTPLQTLKARVAPIQGIPENWNKSPIDRLVFERMAKHGLRPRAPAERRILMRRAYFDLIGLPPKPEEVQHFLNDTRDEAYAAMLDRLLASPQYGERWGRHWLDVARFGESDGYEQNHLRANAWPFRDYVIRSFNEDKPFNQMILEQLAGDQLAVGNPAVEVATGFLVAGPHDTVGNDNKEGQLQQRADDLNDMITATASGFLGLTIHCARCHDHKFDPILQTDYYQLRAIFEGVRHADRIWMAPSKRDRVLRKKSTLKSALAETKARLENLDEEAKPLIERARDEFFKDFRKPVHSRGTEETFEPVGLRFVRLKILATNKGRPPVIDEFEVWTAGPESSNVALSSAGTEIRASSVRKSETEPEIYNPELTIDGKFDRFWYSGEPGAGVLTLKLEQEARVTRVVWSRDRVGAYDPEILENIVTEYLLEGSLDGESWFTLGDSRGRIPLIEAERQSLLFAAFMPESKRTLREQLLNKRTQLQESLAAIKETRAYIGEFEQPEEPTRLFERGDPMKPAGVVSPASPSTLEHLLSGFKLDPSAPEGERRLELARWIADDGNALTVRVLANRVWHYHYGNGIVSTPSDFGAGGQGPTHPALLDYLAGRLQLLGWRLKPLHKEIMLTATYRQSSDADEAAEGVDAEARYLWRFPPRRLEAEAIRDSILAVSGQLDPTMEGLGFRLYKYTVDNVATYVPQEDYGPQTYRRGVYHQSARSVKGELLGEYDCPDSALPAPRRVETTSPLQALALLNNRFVLDQARAFAERVRRESQGENVENQVTRAFQLTLNRSPEAEELDRAVRLVQEHGLVMLCRALFNLNEFLYVM